VPDSGSARQYQKITIRISIHRPLLADQRLLPMTDFVETELRHRCRNPRCRSKLKAPVSNRREAFCARLCHSSFYRKRCLVCEGPMERKTDKRQICKKAKCRNAFRDKSGFGRFLNPSGTSSSAEFLQEVPGNIDPARPLKPSRSVVYRRRRNRGLRLPLRDRPRRPRLQVGGRLIRADRGGESARAQGALRRDRCDCASPAAAYAGQYSGWLPANVSAAEEREGSVVGRDPRRRKCCHGIKCTVDSGRPSVPDCLRR
jgi:hypothetical protein